MASRRRASQEVVAENLAAILRYRGLGPGDAAKLLKVKPYQVRRLVAGEHAATTRTVDQIAAAFGMEPYQLLVPGLDPANPQILRILSPAEERLYMALQAARDNHSK